MTCRFPLLFDDPKILQSSRRSGSMQNCREATVGSVNKYLADARDNEALKAADFELTIFDSESIDVIRSGRLGDQKDLVNAKSERSMIRA